MNNSVHIIDLHTGNLHYTVSLKKHQGPTYKFINCNNFNEVQAYMKTHYNIVTFLVS